MTLASRSLAVTLFAVSSLLLSACAETQLATHYAKKVDWPGQETQKGSYKVGNPYQVGGTWYYPKENYALAETGIASWYGPDFHGKKTANGEVYDQHELTAAHRTLPMPSLVRVTNLENGRAVVVRVNDRGPFSKSRVIDVSRRAAELLGMIGPGTARVRVEVLEKQSRQMAEAARQGVDTSRLTLNDLDRYGSSGAQQVAMVQAPASSGDLPDSLKTPTITVEELNSNGKIVPMAVPTKSVAVTGHVEKGRFLPDPVVTTEPVARTGIFVQAGSFASRANADRLVAQLKTISSARIDEAFVNGRTMYRVKLGPIASVAEADAVLARVSKAGSAGKVIKQ